MTTLTPHEALRLSKAETLAQKHAQRFEEFGDMFWRFDTHGVAALVDEAVAAKDATIKALRDEMQQMEREFQREARDIAAQAASDARAERGDYF